MSRLPCLHFTCRLSLMFALVALCFASGTQASTEPDDPRAEMTAETAPRQLGYTDALVLGLVEGITEYLPISSTGHLLLTNSLLGLDVDDPILDASGEPLRNRAGEPMTLKGAADAYAIVIQAGAIAAVLLLFWRRIWGVILGFLGRDPRGLRLGINLLLAFLPAAVLGLLLDDWIEAQLFAPLPIAIALGGGGILMLAVEHWRKAQRGPQTGSEPRGPEMHELNWRQCLAIGFLQCVAMWPGTSRSMMTIVGGYLVGLRPALAAEFSFLLGLITLTAAAGYKTVSDGEEILRVLDTGPVLVGCFVAFVAAALSVKWLVGYLSRHGLALFAWYRFILAIAVIAVFVL